MKRTIKIGIVITLIVLLILFVFSFAKEDGEDFYAVSQSVYMDAEEKTSFAQAIDKQYAESAANRESVQIEDLLDRDSVALQHIIQLTFSTDEDDVLCREALAQYGIYMFDTEDVHETYVNAFVPSDNAEQHMDVYKPIILYHAESKHWIVACGGQWLNDSWDERWFDGDIGGRDDFGVRYTNTSGEYRSYVTGVIGMLATQSQNEISRTDNRSGFRNAVDGSSEFHFSMQDYKYKGEYVGNQWFGACVYAPGFETYGGVVTAEYWHTSEAGNTNQAIGTIRGAENEWITINDIVYERDENSSFSRKDRGTYIGEAANSKGTMRLYEVDGDNDAQYIYAFWDWEGAIYKRQGE